MISILNTLHRLRAWVVVLIIEIVLIFSYIYLQPYCEPCLPEQFCPPCISDSQISIKYFGLTLIIPFCLWKAINIYKKETYG